MAKQNTAPGGEDRGEVKKNTHQRPPKYAKVVVVGKSVVLVRHHYAKTGDVEAIFNEYLEDKTGEK